MVHDAEILNEAGLKKITTFEDYLPLWQRLVSVNSSDRQTLHQGFYFLNQYQSFTVLLIFPTERYIAIVYLCECYMCKDQFCDSQVYLLTRVERFQRNYSTKFCTRFWMLSTDLTLL